MLITVGIQLLLTSTEVKLSLISTAVNTVIKELHIELNLTVGTTAVKERYRSEMIELSVPLSLREIYVRTKTLAQKWEDRKTIEIVIEKLGLNLNEHGQS